jgi:hypothetical protein
MRVQTNIACLGDEIEEREVWRRAVVKSKLEGTLLGRAVAHREEAQGGRYVLEGEPAITGATAQPTVPALPACSPWHHDPVGRERPLRIDVNAMPGPQDD